MVDIAGSLLEVTEGVVMKRFIARVATLLALITGYAKVSFGVFDADERFSFIGVGSPLLAWLAVFILLTGVVAALPPLLRNIRRNPIKDMRSD